MLQASPLLGAYLGGIASSGHDLVRLMLLLLGSTALTAHVFVLNDWADYDADARVSRPDNPDAAGISRGQIARLSLALLVVAGVALAAASAASLLVGAVIATISFLYSCSQRFGKRTPLAASLNHLTGGALHFLLGYTTAHAVDGKAVALGCFFGLVFAAGHLNQEVRDYEFDLAGGVRTSAVVFGRRRGFLASFALFSAAYLLIVVLAAGGVLPKLLLVGALAWAVQARWSLQALRAGLSLETALHLQRRYRLLFALVGLALLVR